MTQTNFPARGEIHVPLTQVTSRGAWKSLTFKEQLEGKQKCRICGKHGLKFWIFRSDCWEDFQREAVTPAEHFNKPSVWHLKNQTKTPIGVGTMYLFLFMVKFPASWIQGRKLWHFGKICQPWRAVKSLPCVQGLLVPPGQESRSDKPSRQISSINNEKTMMSTRYARTNSFKAFKLGIN